MFEDWITSDTKNVLLVEPEFPIPAKSRNHSNFLPIGLLKIAAYLQSLDVNVELIRYEHEDNNQSTLDFKPVENALFIPDLICVTSIFTYWSKYVKDAVQHFKNKYPNIPIIVGGIYASLLPDHCKSYTGCDDVITGIIPEAEKLQPAYDLVDVDYQILHTTRGCIRKCGFCGTYKIEPDWICKKSIKNEIIKKKLIFYDSNLLANPYIENILDELIELKKEHKINYVESQSGFDGRILMKKPKIAEKLKLAGFKNPRIAWDNKIEEESLIEKQIQTLVDAGYKSKDISIFIIYNYELPYLDLEYKRLKCWEWQVQITDCRYRPLDSTYDNYNSHKITGQSGEDYFIHPNWCDAEVRKFRKNIRQQNMCVRFEIKFYSAIIERKKLTPKKTKEYIKLDYNAANDVLPDAWNPAVIHAVNGSAKK